MESDEERFRRLNSMRKQAKVVNYSNQYKVGAKTLSRNSGMTEAEAKNFIEVYNELNWALRKIEKEQYVKRLPDGTMWLKNPLNGFYYSLRNDRDIGSTLIQGSGDYLFNLWLMYCRKMGLKVHLNYHDEWLTSCEPQDVDKIKAIAKEAMDKVNETLKLNKVVTMDTQVGYSYAECH